MDFEIERRYFLEKLVDFVAALEEETEDVHLSDENRVLFLLDGRPFEALACVNEDSDMICLTTRTADMPIDEYGEAVAFLKGTLDTCWDYCVAVAPVEARYDLSMALFTGGFNFEAFEDALYNLLGCAEAIEKAYEDKRAGMAPHAKSGSPGSPGSAASSSSRSAAADPEDPAKPEDPDEDADEHASAGS